MNKDTSSINEDIKYEESGWAVQRVFWVLVAIVELYALTGGLGDKGFYNTRYVQISGALIEHKRFVRVEKSFEMKVHLQDSVKNFSIAFSHDYISHVQIKQVIPEPVSVSLINGRVIYNFTTENSGTINFFLDPKEKGNITLELEANNERAVISQFIFF